MKIAVAVLLSWLVTLIGYFAVVAWISPRGVEVQAVTYWATGMLAITGPTLYVPVMFALAERLDPSRAVNWLVLPAIGIILSLVPTLLFVASLSTHFVRSVTSQSTLLFFGLFATFGAMFGSAVILIHARGRSNQPLQPPSGADGTS